MIDTSVCRIYSPHDGGYVAPCVCNHPFTFDRAQAALFTPEQAIAKVAELSSASREFFRLDFGFEVEGFDQVAEGPESAPFSGPV